MEFHHTSFYEHVCIENRLGLESRVFLPPAVRVLFSALRDAHPLSLCLERLSTIGNKERRLCTSFTYIHLLTSSFLSWFIFGYVDIRTRTILRSRQVTIVTNVSTFVFLFVHLSLFFLRDFILFYGHSKRPCTVSSVVFFISSVVLSWHAAIRRLNKRPTN